MPIRFSAIKPSKPIVPVARVEARLAYELNSFVSQVEDQMSTYPAQKPTTYRRTMMLARSWSVVPARRVGGALVAKVGSNSNIAPYNRFVQGEEQTGVMAGKGWVKVMTVAQSLWPSTRKRILAVFASIGG